MHSGFIWPSPCSALMLPFLSAVHSYTKGSMCDRISLSYLAASDNHVTELYYLTCLYDIAWAVADRKFDKQNETPEPLSVRLCMDNRCPKTQTQWQPTPLQAICCVLEQSWSTAAGVQAAEMQTAMTDEGLIPADMLRWRLLSPMWP